MRKNMRVWMAWILVLTIVLTNIEMAPAFAVESGNTTEGVLFDADFNGTNTLNNFAMAQEGVGNTVEWITKADELVQKGCLQIAAKASEKKVYKNISKLLSDITNTTNLTIELKVKTIGNAVGKIGLSNDESIGEDSNVLWQGDTEGEWLFVQFKLAINGGKITSTTYVKSGDSYVAVRDYADKPILAELGEGKNLYLILQHTGLVYGKSIRFDDMKIYYTPTASTEEATLFEADFNGTNKLANFGLTQRGTGDNVEWLTEKDEPEQKGCLQISVKKSIRRVYKEIGKLLSEIADLTIALKVKTTDGAVGKIGLSNTSIIEDDKNVLWQGDTEGEWLPIKFELVFTEGQITSTAYVKSEGTYTVVGDYENKAVAAEIAGGELLYLILHHTGLVNEQKIRFDDMKIYYTSVAGVVEDTEASEDVPIGGEVDEATPLLGDEQVDWDKVLPLEEKINPDGTLKGDSYVENLVNHPRIFVSSWDEVRAKINGNDEMIKKWYDIIETEAESYLATPASSRVLNADGNVLESARGGRKRIVVLSFMYGVTGEQKYLDKAYKEMIEMGEWEDWSEFNQYLVTAELMFGYAVAYDWLYDGLTSEQKEKLFEIVQSHGLRDLIYNYEGVQTRINFTTTNTNWNPTCNTSAIATAFAFADEQPLISEYILERAPEFLINAVEPYQSQGAYPEGVGYWELGTTRLVYAMSLLDGGFIDSYKLPDKYYYYNEELYPGLADTCDFAIYYCGPAGRFNYGDCGAGTVSSNAFYWMANKFNKPQYTWYENNLQESTGVYLSGDEAVAALCFYDPENTQLVEFSLDKFYQSERDVNGISVRSSWENAESLFAAMQGGNNAESHMHYSLGTYVIDHNGKRFIRLNGQYDYSLKYGAAATYYKRAEAYNTLVINPSKSADQNSRGIAPLIASGSSDSTAFGVLDMSNVYNAGDAEILSAKRGMMITDNRSRVIVQDEVELSKASEFYWFANTDATIKIAEDGKSVLLEQEGERMLVRIIEGPETAVFSFMDRVSLIEGVYNTVTSGTKLFIHMENVQKLNLAVEYVGLEAGEGVPAAWEYVPMAQWKTEDKQTTDTDFELKVFVDGKEMTFFDVERKEYVVNVESESSKVPQISAEIVGGTGHEVVTQAKAIGESATVIVNANGKSYTYTFKIEIDPFENVESANILKGVRVTVEDTPTTIPDAYTYIYVDSLESIDWRGYPERGLVDGVISSKSGDQSRWAHKGTGSWITVDFGKVYNLHSMGFSGDKQEVRAYKFDVEVSVDGENWTKIYDKGAPKTTCLMSIIALGDMEARYVRLVGKGYDGSDNGWNTWREIRFYESEKQQMEDVKHWPLYFGTSDVTGRVGQTKELIIDGINEVGEFFVLQKNAKISCEIADESMATFADGKITFRQAGTTALTIIVEQNGFSAEVTAEVVGVEGTVESQNPTEEATEASTEVSTEDGGSEEKPVSTDDNGILRVGICLLMISLMVVFLVFAKKRQIKGGQK